MEWKKIKGFDYLVSDKGDLISINEQIRLRPFKKRNGYIAVSMSSNSVKKQYLVHRLVAAAFLPNPENKPHVNHKDGDKSNNHVSNLEWCTPSENEYHSYRVLNKKPPKHLSGASHHSARIVLNTQTGVFYETIAEAAISINMNRYKLSAMLSETSRSINRSNFIKV